MVGVVCGNGNADWDVEKGLIEVQMLQLQSRKEDAQDGVRSNVRVKRTKNDREWVDILD